jgi:hypothetical protein
MHTGERVKLHPDGTAVVCLVARRRRLATAPPAPRFAGAGPRTARHTPSELINSGGEGAKTSAPGSDEQCGDSAVRAAAGLRPRPVRSVPPRSPRRRPCRCADPSPTPLHRHQAQPLPSVQQLTRRADPRPAASAALSSVRPALEERCALARGATRAIA